MQGDVRTWEERRINVTFITSLRREDTASKKKEQGETKKDHSETKMKFLEIKNSRDEKFNSESLRKYSKKSDLKNQKRKQN